jgi:hypothetical protein
VAQAMANRFTALISTSDIKIGSMSLKYNYEVMADKYYALAERLMAGGSTEELTGGPKYDTELGSAFSIGLMDNL